MLYCPVSRCPNIDLRSSGVLVIGLATEVSDHVVESVEGSGVDDCLVSGEDETLQQSCVFLIDDE